MVLKTCGPHKQIYRFQAGPLISIELGGTFINGPRGRTFINGWGLLTGGAGGYICIYKGPPSPPPTVESPG